MKARTGLGGLAVCLLPVLAFAQAESSEKLTAREMFLDAKQKSAARPKPKLRPVVPAAAPGMRTPVASAPTEQEVSTASPPQAEPPAPGGTPDGRVKVMLAAYSPLGLRYTLIKKGGDGRTEDVSPAAVFHSGDHIQLGVEVTEPGYLYIVYQGSSGTWDTLFPSQKIERGDNRVDSGRLYVVPPANVFTFVGKPGVEKLFVIFSRQPEPEMDKWIYMLQGGQVMPAADVPAKPKSPSPTFLMTKVTPIDNSVVDNLREVYSRDLIIDKVDEPAEPAKPVRKQDKSVYIVNPKGAPDSHIVADIRLVHEE